MNYTLIIAIILGAIYGLTIIIGGVTQFKQKSIQIWAAQGMIVAGFLIVISSLLFLASGSYQIFLLIIGLIAMHVLAINNGLKMYGKINPLHHAIRLVISIVIVILFLL